MAPNERSYALKDEAYESFTNNRFESNPEMSLNNNTNCNAEDVEELCEKSLTEKQNTPTTYKMHILWPRLIILGALHVFAIWGLFCMHHIQTPTVWWTILLFYCNAIGLQVGAHRYWSHRSFKATFGLQLFLAALQTLAFQDTIHEWVRNHRCHHKWPTRMPIQATSNVDFSSLM